jgi:muramidase (phage lysozyme)
MPLIAPSVSRSALLNAVAAGETEGSRRRGSGYNMLYGGGTFVGYERFPQWAGKIVNGRPTHAAGRYQDQPGTWAEVAIRYHLPDFSPASQDEGNWQLAKQRYRRVTKRDLEADLSTLTLAFLIEGLQPTWASVNDAFQRRILAFSYEQV